MGSVWGNYLRYKMKPQEFGCVCRTTGSRERETIFEAPKKAWVELSVQTVQWKDLLKCQRKQIDAPQEFFKTLDSQTMEWHGLINFTLYFWAMFISGL